jgi:acyclic terpene utilization AtuA family protein
VSDPIRIGNSSGFFGDRFSAFREMLDGGPLDVLTGDYLAELTMLILGRSLIKNPNHGWARTFLQQLEGGLGTAMDKGVRIVSNAGGLNPKGLADALHELSDRLGLHPKIAYVTGDDLRARAAELGLGTPITANAYLGAWGIAEALKKGADVVVTGRVTDASLVVGPAAAHFGWGREDWDRLAGATVAGHILECGAQATGGNYSFFHEIDARHPGFPLAEIADDGSGVITKHPGTGGAVTVETVTAQLLYEIGGPRYAGPDVTTRFDTIELAQEGPDRVKVSGVKGEPPPPTTKVCLNKLGGFRNSMTFVLVGLDIEAKAALIREQVEAAMEQKPAEILWSLVRSDRIGSANEEEASAFLRVSVRDSDPNAVGRAFSNVAIELALASYPGFTVTSPPGEGAPYGVYYPAFVDSSKVDHIVVMPDGTEAKIEPAATTQALADPDPAALPERLPNGPTKEAPLGAIAGARSGDKGGTANIGVWARTDGGWRWLAHALTVTEIRRMIPEAADLPITRYILPHLRAVNFVIDGILGEGVSSSTRFDPQGKALGEWVRSQTMPIPAELL